MAEFDKKPKLTPKEELFVENYCAETNGNATEAARRAGYARTVVEKAYELPRKAHIAKAIDMWREKRKRTFWVTETEILERMWQEANYYDNGATHAGRINALVWLGKHMGMFGEAKKQDGVKGAGNTYNIINYSSNESDSNRKRVEEAVKEKESEVKNAIEHQVDDESLQNLNESINIKDYSTERKH